MKRVINKIVIIMLALTVLVTPCTLSKAATQAPMQRLVDVLHQGKNKEADGSKYGSLDFKKHTYTKDGGGFFVWAEMWLKTGGTVSYDNDKQEIKYSDYGRDEAGTVNEANYNALTMGDKRNFLEDVLRLANNQVAIDQALMDKNDSNTTGKDNMVTTDTVNEYCRSLQNLSGAGSQLLASLMAETKPDYAAATQIYMPFSGPIGVILGILSILIMALLGVTMALDLAYIVIPAFRLMLDGGTEGNSDKGGKGAMAKIISDEARSAVATVENGSGNTGQGGSTNKVAVGQYFKARWKSLLLLGICLLYLVQGQIYGVIGWIIDLVSGITG